MARSIKQIGTEIREAKSILNREVESIPMGHRGGWACACRQAQESLPVLTKEIQDLVVPNRLVGLFVTGDHAAIVRTIAFLKQNEGFSIDAGALYTRIAQRIEPSFDVHRWWGTVQYDIMCQEFFKVCDQLGYLFIEKAPAMTEGACHGFDAVVDKVRNDLRGNGLGDNVMKQVLTNDIVTQVIDDSIESEQIPVIVTGVGSTQEKAALSSLFGASFSKVIPHNFKVNKNSVLSLFKNEEAIPVD